MRAFVLSLVVFFAAGLGACAGHGRPATVAAIPTGASTGTLAQVYYWRAKPGKFEEYSRYIRELAEP
ncbi:MAG TPA: hypothetical protein VIK25_17100, partial [Gemmatimonadaceae bacterium]